MRMRSKSLEFSAISPSYSLLKQWPKGPTHMPVRDVIVQKLSAKFAPTHLEVIDESSRHHGHAGSRPEGETHFRVRIATPRFAGLTRIAQHRAVMDELATELKNGVHALAIEVIAPGAPEVLPTRVSDNM